VGNLKVRTQRLDHLGLIAGLCNRIGLISLIDQLIPSKRKISVGQAVQALILNGLGFTGRALYLGPEFFENKPLDVLIGPGIAADELNADTLARALDDIYAYGPTELFAHVASHACNTFGLKSSAGHLDTTSISFSGQYLDSSEDPTAVQITHGYSKDHAPDLKQLIVVLLCAYKSHIPTWFAVKSGNASDKVSLVESIERFHQQVADAPEPFVTIFDAGGYSEENIQRISGRTHFLSRVPETIKEVKALYDGAELSKMTPAADPRYRYQEVKSAYGGVAQRWLLVHSSANEEAHQKTIQKKRAQERTRLEAAVTRQSKKAFHCANDARKEMLAVASGWTFYKVGEMEVVEHKSYKKRGRPSADAPVEVRYSVNVKELVEDDEAYAKALQRAGFFVLATDAPEERLSAAQMLEDYKAQSSSVEQGFRFLKSPEFFATGVYLQKRERVIATMMVMTLCLLVYSLCEHHLRQQLKRQNAFVPDQKGKATQKITMRRVYQMFEGVDLLVSFGRGPRLREVLNLNPVHLLILRLLGSDFQKPYGLSS
jgi:transposase